MIDYRGPAGTVRAISCWRVLEGSFAPGTFRGKIVVVGATEPILHDVSSTSTHPQMSGPEVEAGPSVSSAPAEARVFHQPTGR